jgi:Tfp pilus assembly protein PilX
MINVNKRGIALYLVLAVLLVVSILSNVLLNLISTQSKLTAKQTRRIQAFYAAQAGIRLAVANLQANDPNWATGTGNTFTRVICRQATTVFPCTAANLVSPNMTDAEFPTSINFIQVTVGPYDSALSRRPLSAVVNYTMRN